MSKFNNSQWFITTVKAPLTFTRGVEETWYLNPRRRYVMNGHHVGKLFDMLASVSDIGGTPHYHPLNASQRLAGKHIFVERFRDRGIGDLLFLTGPLFFMHAITGNDLEIDVYAFSDRGAVLEGSPYLAYGTPLIGPTHYDDFQNYDYQWLVGSATESNEETDQLNVYDALFAQIGINPAQIDPKFKRPYVSVSAQELNDLHQFWHTLWEQRTIDMRKTGYYVLAPLTHSPLRTAPYALWLELAKELSKRRPVFIIGQTSTPLPDLDMAAGEFVTKTGEVGEQVISLLGRQIRLRSIVALISQATAFVGLDSGPLYIAQACRVPAISLWGPHDPGVRIGYDPDYMELAVWNQQFCLRSACYAYSSFPIHKCPEGTNQKICQCLLGTTVDDVLNKMEKVESRRVTSLGCFKAA